MEKEEVELKEQLKQLKKKELQRRKDEALERKNKNAILIGSIESTAIFISNLGDSDVLQEDLIRYFSKYGIIKKNKEGDTLCKLYFNKAGKFEGNALIIYARKESVQMAIELMDGTILNGNKIKVEVAKFEENKREAEELLDSELSLKKKLQISTNSELISIQSYSDADNDWVAESKEIQRLKRTAVLTNIFDIYDTPDDEELDDISEDLLDGCKQVGPVEEFKLISDMARAEITFENEASAEEFCKRMHNRFFGGRKLIAYMINYDKESDGNKDDSSGDEIYSNSDDLLA